MKPPSLLFGECCSSVKGNHCRACSAHTRCAPQEFSALPNAAATVT